MEANLQYEDLLIKLRAKLNEEKIKLWEPPYTQAENEIPQSLQELARKYATEFNMDGDSVLQALRELQLHSMERVRANEEYKETGVATFRVKAMLPAQKPMQMNIQKKLIAMASELISAVAVNVNVPDNRLKLIFNGKVLKPSMTLAEQGVKNGAQIMALIMADTPEEISKEDSRYRELKATLDDATLLSEYGVDIDGDEDYMKLEDQNGVAMEVPPAERRSLLVGLALHERGRVAIRHKDYALALVLLLEADRQFSECRSSLLQSVDNWAVLQLDVCWCYSRLRCVSGAADAALRLGRAAAAFTTTYGDHQHRLIAIKGNAESERILFMRLYLLQGIVAYHQNNREEAKRLFEKAEYEMNFLRVSEESVSSLMELGWSLAQARTGLRSTGGDVARAHHHLERLRHQRHLERERHRHQRAEAGASARARRVVVRVLVRAGHEPGRVRAALHHARGALPHALRLLATWDWGPRDPTPPGSGSGSDSDSYSDDEPDPDNKLVEGLEAMGYMTEEAKTALKLAQNNVSDAVEILVAAAGQLVKSNYTSSSFKNGSTVSSVILPTSAQDPRESSNPSTSSGVPSEKKKKREHKRKERDLALQRLSSTIRMEEDDYLDCSLVDEEECLAQYKSLL